MAVVTKYVGWSSADSDYVCDGVDDHVQINQALAWAAANPGNIVYLRGPFTYDLGVSNGYLKIGGNTHLTGDTTAVCRVNDAAMWTNFLPLIGQYGGSGAATSNIEISNITLDGNESHTYHAGVGDPERIHGKGYYNCIFMRGANTSTRISNIYIHDVRMIDSLGDGVRIEYGNNVRVENCYFQNLMHSSVFIVVGDGIDIANNEFWYITNAGVRFDHVQNSKIRGNTIDPWMGTTNAPKGGDNAIQIGNQPLTYNHTELNMNIDIYDNIIRDSAIGGICFMDVAKNAGTTPQTVHIYNNTISGCGWGNSSVSRRGGITIYSWGSGLNIEYNTISDNYKSGIRVETAIASGVVNTIQNNNITGTTQLDFGGYGIYNGDSTDMSLTIKNNYMLNNIGGNYYMCTPLSESLVPITETLPGGSTDTDDIVVNPPADDEVEIGAPEPDPVVIIYQKGGDTSHYITGRTAYIDGVPFDWITKKIDVGNALSQDKCPGLPGWAISDFDMCGAELTMDCTARSLSEMEAVIASLSKLGRVTVELGGDFSNWQVTGVKGDYSTDLRLSEAIPRQYHPYSFLLVMDSPYYESVIQRSRSRYIYGTSQFSADNCYAGNVVSNSSFEDWTPDLTIDWSMGTTPADNEWRTVRYAQELGRYCAVSSTGTPPIMLLDNGDTAWRLPTGSNSYGSKTGWRGLAWCAEWNLWMACSTGGTTQKVITSSDGGDTWIEKTTPVNDNGWSQIIWIPPNDTITTGRAIVLAQSGTAYRSMYTDDQGDNWTSVVTANENGNWINGVYSEDLALVVAIAYSGVNGYRVMISDDYGESWTSCATPADLNYTGICWADSLGLFVVCAESTIDNATNKQIITSPDGIMWTLQTTPIAYQETTPTGGDVQTLTETTQVGYTWTALTTSYSGGAAPDFEIAAPASGNFYRVDQVYCKLKSQYAGVTAWMKMTVQFGAGAETTVAEWSNNTTTYVTKTLDLALESAADQTVTIRTYMKTSNSNYKAIATEVGYRVTETGTVGATVTYYYNQWRSVCWAREIGLLMCVSQTGYNNSAMYSTDGLSWFLTSTPYDNAYTSIAYAEDENKFVAVGKSGTGNRTMYSENYGELNDIAPNSWTLVTTGQERHGIAPMDGLYSYQINGNGSAGSVGEIKQHLYFESGVRYVLSAFGKIEGLTAGSLKVDIMLGESVYKELVWDADGDWVQKQISFMFEVKPTDAYIRVRGVGLNNGAVAYCDRILVEPASYFELSSTGSEIITYGSVDTTPDVIVTGTSAASESTTAGVVKTYVSNPGYVYTTPLTYYNTGGFDNLVLPAPGNNSAYRLDQVYLKLRSNHAGTTAYCKVTAQFGSGSETTLAEWSNKTETFQTKIRNLSLLGGNGQTLTLRFYQKVSSSSYKSVITDVGYVVTVVNTVTGLATENLYLWNTDDPTKIMHCCDVLMPKYKIEINADSTGSLTYAEDFLDENYSYTEYAESGVTYNDANNTIVIGSGGYIIFPMDCKYPVTGIPSMTAIVKSGAPQIYIAEDVAGSPGTFYAIDGNVTTGSTDTQITRLLNNITSLQLASKTKFYVKITPYSSGTCEFGGMSIYAPLSTVDAERFKIYATKKANTIAVQTDDDASAIVTLRYRDLSPAR